MIARSLQLTLIALCLSVLGYFSLKYWHEIGPRITEARCELLLLSLALGLCLNWMATQGWRACLLSSGYQMQRLDAGWVWLLGSAGRYLPGSIWSYLSRAALAKQYGVPMSACGVSMGLETMLIAVSSLSVGIPAVLSLNEGWAVLPATLVALGIGAALLHPGVLRLLGRSSSWLGRKLRLLQLPSASTVLRLYLFYVGYWLLWGAAFYLFAVSLQPIDAQDAPLLISSFALAYCAGFIAPLAPGGLGVRESVLFGLLLNVMPAPAAITISVASRLWLILVELGLVGILGLLQIRRSNSARR